MRTPNLVEAVAQLVILVATIVAVFVPSEPLPLSVLPLPVLLWGAVRLPARWVSAELLISGVLISLFTTGGSGPYAEVVSRGYEPEMIGLLLQIAAGRLPPRDNRINPRVVKVKMSKWKKKRVHHRSRAVKPFHQVIEVLK